MNEFTVKELLLMSLMIRCDRYHKVIARSGLSTTVATRLFSSIYRKLGYPKNTCEYKFQKVRKMLIEERVFIA